MSDAVHIYQAWDEALGQRTSMRLLAFMTRIARSRAPWSVIYWAQSKALLQGDLRCASLLIWFFSVLRQADSDTALGC